MIVSTAQTPKDTTKAVRSSSARALLQYVCSSFFQTDRKGSPAPHSRCSAPKKNAPVLDDTTLDNVESDSDYQQDDDDGNADLDSDEDGGIFDDEAFEPGEDDGMGEEFDDDFIEPDGDDGSGDAFEGIEGQGKGSERMDGYQYEEGGEFDDEVGDEVGGAVKDDDEGNPNWGEDAGDRGEWNSRRFDADVDEDEFYAGDPADDDDLNNADDALNGADASDEFDEDLSRVNGVRWPAVSALGSTLFYRCTSADSPSPYTSRSSPWSRGLLVR